MGSRGWKQLGVTFLFSGACLREKPRPFAGRGEDKQRRLLGWAGRRGVSWSKETLVLAIPPSVRSAPEPLVQSWGQPPLERPQLLAWGVSLQPGVLAQTESGLIGSYELRVDRERVSSDPLAP